MTELGKRARQKLERPAEILEAAREEFFQKGFMSARIEDVAKTVGVTKGTVYLYFETKEALFEAVVRRYSPTFEIELYLEGLPLAGRITAYLSRFHELITLDRETRETLHLLIADGRHFPQLVDSYFAQFLEPVVQKIRAMLLEGVAKGEIRQKALAEFPEILLAPSILANIWSITLGDRRPLDHRLYFETYAALLVSALTAGNS